jgi:hypothetical protein
MKHYTKYTQNCKNCANKYNLNKFLERISISINWHSGCVIGYEDSALIGNGGKFCDYDSCLMQCVCNGFQSYFG